MTTVCMLPTKVIAALAAMLLTGAVAHAQLRGHGGPVRAVAVAPDGESAISGSFDSSAIRWSLTRNAALQVLRFHEGAVNAVAFLKDGRMATAGEDGRIAVWRRQRELPGGGNLSCVIAGALPPGGAEPRRPHRLGREGHRGADGGRGAGDEGEVGPFEARVRAGQSFCPEKTACAKLRP